MSIIQIKYTKRLNLLETLKNVYMGCFNPYGQAFGHDPFLKGISTLLVGNDLKLEV